MSVNTSASATSGRYLMEIKAIYERLKGEYEYLRKKQEQQLAPLDDLEAELGHQVKKLGKLNLDSDGLESVETNHQVQGEKVDEMIASSAEELMENENASLREKLAQLEAEVGVKNRDWRRIRASYEQLQEANEKLKQQLSEANSDHTKLETRYKQLASRFNNLQTFKLDRIDSANSKASKSSVATAKSSVGMSKVFTGKGIDAEKLLNFSLEALAEVAASSVHLPSQSTAAAKSSSIVAAAASSTSTNLIFALAELLRNLPPSLASQTRIVEPLLRLFYDALPWTLPTSANEEGSSDLRPGVTLSLQKCGETLFRCGSSPVTTSTTASVETETGSTSTARRSTAIFFRSSQLTVRFLSTLIILRTVTRADILAQTLDCLLRDCQSEAGREAFVRFDAARVVVLFLRPHNKAFVGTSLAIVARLLTASQMPLNAFTDIFMTERFICSLSMLLDSPAVNGEDLEKLATILAKLASTVRTRQKSNGTAARLFNAFGITETVQRMLKRLPSDNSSALSPMIVSNFRQIVTYLAVQSPPPSIVTANEASMVEDLSCGSILQMS